MKRTSSGVRKWIVASLRQGGRRLFLLPLALMGLGGAGAAVYASARRPAQPSYQTAAASKGRVVARVTASGTVSALVTVQVGSQVSGRVKELAADFNSPVTKGQVIARIDPAPFLASLEQARANVRMARANLSKAKVQREDAERQLLRDEALVKDKLIGQAERDTAATTAAAARSQVDSAAASLDQATATAHQAEINLAYATITSPIDGVVISRSVDVGQTVAASLQAPTLFTIAGDLTQMQVDSSVAESDVGRLQPGMKSTFTVDAFPGETFEGTVRQVRNAAQTVQNVVTYDAVIDVANPALKLRPGMTANVTFVWARRDDALLVPSAALRFRPTAAPATTTTAQPQGTATAAGRRGGGARNGNGSDGATTAATASKTVWVLRAADQAPQAVRVQTGVSDGRVTEVTGGELNAGDLVVIADLAAPAAPATPATPAATASGGRNGGLGRVF